MPDETGDQQGHGRRRPWPPRGSEHPPVGQAPPWPTSDDDQRSDPSSDGSDWYRGASGRPVDGDSASSAGAPRATAGTTNEGSPSEDRFARERFELYGRGRDRSFDESDDGRFGFWDPYRQSDQREATFRPESRDPFRTDRSANQAATPPGNQASGQPGQPGQQADDWYRGERRAPAGAGPATAPPPGPPSGPPPRDPYGRGPDGYGRHPIDPSDPEAELPRRRPVGRSLAATLGLTLLGTVFPGSGLLAAGRKLLGGLILGAFLLLLLIAGGLMMFERQAVMHAVLDPDALALLGIGLFVVGLMWVGVIVATHRSLRSRMATPLDRIVGAFVVAALALIVIAPLTVGSRYAFVSRDLVSTVFADENSRSVTRPQNVTEHDPWAGEDRVNILLLGGDGAANRSGIRTDTVMVASIDTDTGDTVLFSLPRNLQKIPFPADSPLADEYPGGVFDEGGGYEDPEYFLNAMYRNVPAEHPGILGETDNEGADVMKIALGNAVGLKLDYFVLVNLAGFEQIVDAMGGITVNINTRVAIGGDTDAGIPPSDWLEPGPNQHLDGYHALWFARGRYGADDYQRMQRQRCAMDAIIDKAQPAELLRRYEAIAQASKKIVRTDIPGTLLSPFVDLSMKVKSAEIRSIVFDNTLIEEPWEPDFDFIREKVAKAIAETEDTGKPAPDNGSNGQASNGGSGGSDSGGDKSDGEKGAADPIASSCEYNPE